MIEKTLHSTRIYEGRVLSLDVLDVEMHNGVRALREIVRHAGAVAVLARIPDGRFALVRQFRKPVEQPMLEVVAGILEPNEEPEHAARREIREETGHHVRTISGLGTIYPSPGYTDEVIHVFFAELGPDAGASDPDHDEHLELVLMSRDEVEECMRNGEIQDGKTLAAWLLAEKMACGL